MSTDSQASHMVPFDIEAPVPIMFWDPLEFVLAVTLMGFGVISQLWVLGLVLGGGVLVGSRYLKRGAKRGAMQHMLWAYGLQLDNPLAKAFKPAWVNDFYD
ncbi:MAG: type IV conjugative transfer system protein TraL [Agitococcus sp.]|nr:type IV conjugative transfer system protein TraL [Agitococcus sp.]